MLQVTKNFVIVCDDCDGEALATLGSKLRHDQPLVVKHRASATAEGDAEDSRSHGRLFRHRGDGRQVENAKVSDLARSRVSHESERHHRGLRDRQGAGRIKQIKAQTDEHVGVDRENAAGALAKLAARRGDQGRRCDEVEMKERSLASRTPSPQRAPPREASCRRWCCAAARRRAVTMDKAKLSAKSATGLRSSSERLRSRQLIAETRPGRLRRRRKNPHGKGKMLATTRARMSTATCSRPLIDPAKVTRSHSRTRQHRRDGVDDGDAVRRSGAPSAAPAPREGLIVVEVLFVEKRLHDGALFSRADILGSPIAESHRTNCRQELRTSGQARPESQATNYQLNPYPAPYEVRRL